MPPKVEKMLDPLVPGVKKGGNEGEGGTKWSDTSFFLFLTLGALLDDVAHSDLYIDKRPQ